MERAALLPELGAPNDHPRHIGRSCRRVVRELAETGAVGRAVEIRETGANHVQVIEANLATFFGGV